MYFLIYKKLEESKRLLSSKKIPDPTSGSEDPARLVTQIWINLGYA